MVSSQKAAIARISSKYTNNIPRKDQQIRRDLAAVFKEAGIEDVVVDTKLYKEKNSISKILARVFDLMLNKGAVIVTTTLVGAGAVGLVSLLGIASITPVGLIAMAVISLGVILFNMFLRRSKVDRYEAYKQQMGGFEDIL